MDELALKIRVLRVQKNMTQEDLARASGVCPCSICFIENGKKKPRASTVVKIANALSVEPEELLKYVL